MPAAAPSPALHLQVPIIPKLDLSRVRCKGTAKRYLQFTTDTAPAQQAPPKASSDLVESGGSSQDELTVHAMLVALSAYYDHKAVCGAEYVPGPKPAPKWRVRAPKPERQAAGGALGVQQVLACSAAVLKQRAVAERVMSHAWCDNIVSHALSSSGESLGAKAGRLLRAAGSTCCFWRRRKAGSK
jgi:hypothetical protein